MHSTSNLICIIVHTVTRISCKDSKSLLSMHLQANEGSNKATIAFTSWVKKRVTFDRLTLYHFNQHNKNNQKEDRGCQTCKLTSKVLYLSQPRLSTSPTTQRNRRSRVLAPSFVNGRNNGSYGSSRFSFVSSMNVRQGKFKIEKYTTWIQCHHYF